MLCCCTSKPFPANGSALGIAGVEQLPRRDRLAHREALRLPASKVVEKLVEIVGRKLTAYISGVKNARAVDRWIAGGETALRRPSEILLSDGF